MQLVGNTIFPDWVPLKKGNHRLIRIVQNTIECRCGSQFRAYKQRRQQFVEGDNPVVAWTRHLGLIK